VPLVDLLGVGVAVVRDEVVDVVVQFWAQTPMQYDCWLLKGSHDASLIDGFFLFVTVSGCLIVVGERFQLCLPTPDTAPW